MAQHRMRLWHTQGQVGRRENFGFVVIDEASLIDGVQRPRAFKFDFPHAISQTKTADMVVRSQTEGPPLVTLPDGENLTASEVWTEWSWSSLSLWTGPAPVGAHE